MDYGSSVLWRTLKLQIGKLRCRYSNATELAAAMLAADMTHENNTSFGATLLMFFFGWFFKKVVL